MFSFRPFDSDSMSDIIFDNGDDGTDEMSQVGERFALLFMNAESALTIFSFFFYPPMFFAVSQLLHTLCCFNLVYIKTCS